MNWSAAAFAVALCLTAAGLEAVLGGKDFPKWLQSLNRPRLYAPLFVWVLVAGLTYLIQGAIAYRLVAQRALLSAVPRWLPSLR